MHLTTTRRPPEETWEEFRDEGYPELVKDVQEQTPDFRLSYSAIHIRMNDDTPVHWLDIRADYRKGLTGFDVVTHTDVPPSGLFYTELDIISTETQLSILDQPFTTSHGFKKNVPQRLRLREQSQLAFEHGLYLTKRHVDNTDEAIQEEEPVIVQMTDLWIQPHWEDA